MRKTKLKGYFFIGLPVAGILCLIGLTSGWWMLVQVLAFFAVVGSLAGSVLYGSSLLERANREKKAEAKRTQEEEGYAELRRQQETRAQVYRGGPDPF